MQSMEDILNDIHELPNAPQLLTFYEIKDLPQILSESETIECMTTATMKQRKGLITLTDERFLFLYTEEGSTRFFQVDYEDIKITYHTLDGFYGEIDLFLPESKVNIKDIPQQDIEGVLETFDNNIPLSPSDIQPKKGSFFGGFFKFIGVLCFIGFLIGLGISIYEEFVPPTAEKIAEESSMDGLSLEKAKEQYQLEFSPLSIDKEDGVFFGTITNHSAITYESVYVDIIFYDKEGKVVDYTLKSIEHFVPGETWNLDYYVYVEEGMNIEKAEIKAVDAFEQDKYEEPSEEL